MDEAGIMSSMCVWNVDETGMQEMPKKRKVLGRKGRRANIITPAEKGTTSTALVMANALGLKVPPMVIHKGAKVRDE